MADNDSMRGRGRGTGRGISRGRGRARGRGSVTSPQPSSGQPTHPSTSQPTHHSTSQIPIAPQPHQSAPSPHLSSTESPHVPFTPSPSHTPADASSGNGAYLASSSPVSSSPQIGSIDSDRRMWIRPGPQYT